MGYSTSETSSMPTSHLGHVDSSDLLPWPDYKVPETVYKTTYIIQNDPFTQDTTISMSHPDNPLHREDGPISSFQIQTIADSTISSLILSHHCIQDLCLDPNHGLDIPQLHCVKHSVKIIKIHDALTRIVRSVESMRIVASRRTVRTSDQWWGWNAFTLHVTWRRWYEPLFGVASGSLFNAIDCIYFTSVGKCLCDVLITLDVHA
jgi:hypothetical protein